MEHTTYTHHIHTYSVPIHRYQFPPFFPFLSKVSFYFFPFLFFFSTFVRLFNHSFIIEFYSHSSIHPSIHSFISMDLPRPVLSWLAPVPPLLPKCNHVPKKALAPPNVGLVTFFPRFPSHDPWHARSPKLRAHTAQSERPHKIAHLQ